MERLNEVVGFRLTSDEMALLRREAGGPSKVSAYIRGLIRGARAARAAQTGETGEKSDG